MDRGRYNHKGPYEGRRHGRRPDNGHRGQRRGQGPSLCRRRGLSGQGTEAACRGQKGKGFSPRASRRNPAQLTPETDADFPLPGLDGNLVSKPRGGAICYSGTGDGSREARREPRGGSGGRGPGGRPLTVDHLGRHPVRVTHHRVSLLAVWLLEASQVCGLCLLFHHEPGQPEVGHHHVLVLGR